jgi:hypothetical protein
MYRTLVIGSVLLAVISSPFVYADNQSTDLTESQISIVKASCLSVQSTLNRIHANDALSRVHLGQEYETISTKFMAPMNSRIALAKLDNVALTRTTVDFNSKLSDFRTLYQQYEETMLHTIQTKCVDQPEEFYSSLLQAQSDRSAVRQSVAGLANLVTQYKQEADALRDQAISASQQGDQ